MGGPAEVKPGRGPVDLPQARSALRLFLALVIVGSLGCGSGDGTRDAGVLDPLEIGPASELGEEVLLSGRTQEPGWWRLSIERGTGDRGEASRLHLEHRSGTGTTEAVSSIDDLRRSPISLITTVSSSGPDVFILGSVRPEVSQVRLHLRDGSSVKAELSETASTGTRFYVVILDDTGDPLQAVAYVKTGEEVGRAQVPGEPTQTETESEKPDFPRGTLIETATEN